MNILFSFSLQGQEPKYVKGVQANLDAITNYFGNTAVMRVYGDYLPPLDTKDRCMIDWIRRDPKKDLSCHFWRFLAAVDARFDYVCIRDIDSVVSIREYNALLDWFKSGKHYHCMRDHHWHAQAPNPVQGGLWGLIPKYAPPNFETLLDWWLRYKGPFKRYSDMWFLNRYIYPHILHNGIQHDGCGSRWGGIPFPTTRLYDEYVGSYAF